MATTTSKFQHVRRIRESFAGPGLCFAEGEIVIGNELPDAVMRYSDAYSGTLPPAIEAFDMVAYQRDTMPRREPLPAEKWTADEIARRLKIDVGEAKALRFPTGERHEARHRGSARRSA